MLLTFELSSFIENGFLVYCISYAVAADTSRWTPKSARRQNRETDAHTHTHTRTHSQTHRTTTVTLAHVHRGLISNGSQASKLIHFGALPISACTHGQLFHCIPVVLHVC